MKIHTVSIHFIWIAALLEFITVPMVVLLSKLTSTGLKNPLHGILVGFVGVSALFYCINRLLDKLDFHLGEYRVRSIHIFTSAFWSGFILALIFAIQQFLKTTVSFDYPAKEIVLGFLSAGGAVLFSGLFYRVVIKFAPFFSVRIHTAGGNFIVENYSLLKISFLAAMYEAIALPILVFWTFYPEHQIIAAAIAGIIGGAVGGMMIWILSVLFSSSIGWISLKKLTR
jgi:hypothetical protein